VKRLFSSGGITKIDEAGNIGAEYTCSFPMLAGMIYHNGYIFAGEQGGQNNIYQLELAESEVVEVARVIKPVNTTDYCWNIAHDGFNLLYSPFDGTDIFVIDDALVDWLSSENLSGTIAAGESVDIPVILDAANLNPGVYSADLNINYNDPLHTGTIYCTVKHS